ncbi:DNA recombination protein RmuC [Erysipelotrichaceae bacterium OH741_COT-311]|nr:DNA recombination protein RmuC [Erysipelotrichaceae bacterium OH741_COT-311]
MVMNEYGIIMIGVAFVLMILVLIYFLNSSRLKQQLFLQELMNKETQMKSNQIHELKEKMSQDLLLFQSTMNDALKKDLHQLNETTMNRLFTLEKKVNDSLTTIQDVTSTNLMKFQGLMTDSLKSDFHKLNESTFNKLMNIEHKVNESLSKGFESTSKTFNDLMQQITRIDETQKNLNTLSNEITSLQNILLDKKSRGTYGEVELYTILNNSFGDNQKLYQRQYKLSNDKVADCVIFAPEPLGKIMIDSKFPFENYNKMYNQSLDEKARLQARGQFASDVKKHLKDIHDKYIIQGETAEIAFMFIPAEAIFAEIFGNFDELVQLSYQYHVYIVSPTTLMAYITAIKAIYIGQQRNKQVEVIQQVLNDLAVEFKRFDTRFSDLNKRFINMNQDFEKITTTSSKLIKRFDRIEKMEFTKEELDDKMNNNNYIE